MSISTNPTNDTQIFVLAALLLSMAAVILLIASLNVANTMLARSAARKKEIAIRLALGAGRKNIVQQLFAEAFLLAILGGAFGLVIAWWSTSFLPQSLSRLSSIDVVFNTGPDIRILGATLAFCILSTMLFGFAPAWNLSKPDVATDLKDGGSPDAVRRRIFSRGNVLVIGQISLSLALLTAAGLFIRSSMRAAGVDPGFRIESQAVVEIDPSLAGYNESQGIQVYRNLMERLPAVPGVQSVSLAASIPFGMFSFGRTIERSTDAANNALKIDCQFNIVSSEYFRTLGIPVLRGRAFSSADAVKNPSHGVAIVDQIAAKRLWPDEDAVGKIIRMQAGNASAQTVDLQVVGVSGTVLDHIAGGGLQPHLYVPLGQEYYANMNLHLRVAAASPQAEAQVLQSVRKEIRAIDAQLPVLTMRTFQQHLDNSFDFWIVRTGARTFLIFGAVALLLAMVGLYGVRAYTVARRTREIGIRMALGAKSSDALRMILGEGLAVTSIGVALGFLLSLPLGKILSSFLYDVTGIDPLVLVLAPALLAGVSLLACYLPARRAALVDPMVALRYE